MTEHVHGPDCAHGSGAPVKLGAVGGKEPCPCGSGKKYKHCCYRTDAAPQATQASQATPVAGESAKADAPGATTAGIADGETEAAPPAAKAAAAPKVPTFARGPAMPPRNPPQGAGKALNRRSGHR